MIATSTTRSSRLLGRDFGSVCICARLSTWKTPTVSAAWSMSKTSGISSGSESRTTQVAQSCSISCRVSSIAASIPSPSRSSLMSLSSSTSRLSNWTTTRSFIVARSIGAMSMRGAAVTSIPPEWIDRCRGKRSIRAQNSSQRSQSDMPTVLPPRACGPCSGSILATELCGSALPSRSTPIPPRISPSVAPLPSAAAAAPAPGVPMFTPAQWFGRPSRSVDRSVDRSGGAGMPLSGSSSRPVATTVAGGRSASLVRR